jgi:hypothetical protein
LTTARVLADIALQSTRIEFFGKNPALLAKMVYLQGLRFAINLLFLL